jgi:hypothetical protein
MILEMQHLVRLPTEQTARLSRASKHLIFNWCDCGFIKKASRVISLDCYSLPSTESFRRPRWAADGDNVLYKRTVGALDEIGAVAMMGGDGVLAA